MNNEIKYIVQRKIMTSQFNYIRPYFKFKTYAEARKFKHNAYPLEATMFDLSDNDCVDYLKIANVI